ncbi:MAG: cupin domain-containing protein [Clostridiales bacterium]|nr:cupin domain-containing protein [Clostridiales bacterium]
MDVIVKKPTPAEKQAMEKMPVWSCGESEFDWHYDSEEICLLIEGEVTVIYDDKSVSFEKGDYVIFPKGLSCVWKVKKPVQKYYVFK